MSCCGAQTELLTLQCCTDELYCKKFKPRQQIISKNIHSEKDNVSLVAACIKKALKREVFITKKSVADPSASSFASPQYVIVTSWTKLNPRRMLTEMDSAPASLCKLTILTLTETNSCLGGIKAHSIYTFQIQRHVLLLQVYSEWFEVSGLNRAKTQARSFGSSSYKLVAQVLYLPDSLQRSDSTEITSCRFSWLLRCLGFMQRRGHHCLP